MIDSKIKEYLNNGGTLFNIHSIDYFRDGGTKALNITGNSKTFYIHKDDKTLHSAYPPSNENKIYDILEIEYIKDRLQTYIEQQLDEYKRTLIVYNDIQGL